MRKLIFLLILSIFFLISAPKSYAQESWIITNFTSDSTLKSSGEVMVTEKIDIDFKTLDKHGIYRDIPYAYSTQTADKKYLTITLNDVTRDGNDEKYTVTTDDTTVRIKIGDAKKTISGSHTYTISYTVIGAILAYPSYDEFYWNATGTNWEVPIEKAQAFIHLPSDALIQAACYVGVTGSTQSCPTMTKTAKDIAVTSDRLEPGEGMTVAVGFKKGLLPILVGTRPKTYWERLTVPTNILLFLIISVLGSSYVLSKWYRQGRDSWSGDGSIGSGGKDGVRLPLFTHETVVVEFIPPDKLRPAEIGVLLDEKADTLDITATIIDLAQRGYLRIEEIKKTWLLGKVDYKLTRTAKKDADLLPYEKELLSRLFKTKSVLLSSLKRTFSQDLVAVKKLLYQEVLSKELFPSNPDAVRMKYFIIGVLLTVLPLALFFFTGLALSYPITAAFGTGVTVVGLILTIFAGKMPKRTAYGHELLRRSQGYKLFISGAEKYRQRFYEQHNLFDEILPYAIIFGLTEKFADAMKDMGLTPQKSGWYSGSTTSNPYLMITSIHAFSNAFSTTISTPPQSSGSGGGGSSGGGFGGGGGGQLVISYTTLLCFVLVRRA